MRYRIDAWLERAGPEVRVLDSRTGAVLLNWGSEQLCWFVERGYLDYEDLLNTRDGTGNNLANRMLSLESRNIMVAERLEW